MIEHANDIATWFLVLTLFLPRLGLIIAWFSGDIPLNTIPFWGDFFMAVFIPRILILIYIITNMGFGAWAIAHLIVCVLSFVGNIIQVTMRQARAS
jgi:hypothetical protein